MVKPMKGHFLCSAATSLILLLLSQCTEKLPDSSEHLPPPVTPQTEDSRAFDPMYPTKVPQTIVFERDLKPLLEIKCVQCHNHIDAKDNAGLNLETRHTAMTTGRNAPVIIPGKPNSSLIIKVLELEVTHPTNMPPSPDKIWGVRMKILKKWIQQGAIWPDHVKMIRPQDYPN